MKLECVLILLVHITANKSLFLDESTIASTGQSSDIFQQVLDLSRNETRRLQNYVYVMEQKLNNINVALEQKINKSEQEIAMLSKELKEEKSRGVKLQMYSDELTFKFYNLSVEYARVMSRMQSLENQNAELKISVNNLTTIFGGVDLSTLMTDHTDLLELKRKQGKGGATWENVPSHMCNQRKLKSAYASAQSIQSRCSPHEESSHR